MVIELLWLSNPYNEGNEGSLKHSLSQMLQSCLAPYNAGLYGFLESKPTHIY